MSTLYKFVLVASLLIMSYSYTTALPRFASRMGTTCQSCHVNPTGAMMRQAFGVRYGREELPVPAWAPAFETEDFTNVIANVLGIGADMRTLFYSVHGGNALYQMQGDLYINLRIAKKVSLFLNKGLYSGFEIFGLLDILPSKGYIKLGKFLPDYGTRLDDHTTFIRTYTGLTPELGRPELTGGEAAISPGPFTITGGFYNSTEALVGSGTNKKTFMGRVEGMFNLAEHVNLGLGVNYLGNGTLSSSVMQRITSDVGVSIGVPGTAANNTLMGGFGSFSYQNLTLFGEVDFMKTDSAGQKITGLITYLEADYPVVTGVDLKFAYDFYDPNKDIQNGSISRYSAGVEFFPIAGVEVRPLYRWLKTQNAITALGKDSWTECDLVVHFYF